MESENIQPQQLDEHVRQHNRVRILGLMGTVDFHPEWDCKTARRLGIKRIPQGDYAISLRELSRMPRPGKK